MTDSTTQTKKTCFVAMPVTTPEEYAEKSGDPAHFTHVLEYLFTPALQDIGYEVIPPSVLGADLIHAEIIKNLEQVDLVLCDMSSLNPNVLFELGIRTALDRPVVIVKDSITPRLPFDVNAINTHTYSISLDPWVLRVEVPRLVGHIKASTRDESKTGNAIWRYFGLTKRASPSEAAANPLEAKIDIILGELEKSQFGGRTSVQAAPLSLSDEEPEPQSVTNSKVEITRYIETQLNERPNIVYYPRSKVIYIVTSENIPEEMRRVIRSITPPIMKTMYGT